MFSSSFLPLVGAAFPFFALLDFVSCKPSSVIPFTVHGGGVQFLADPNDPGNGGVDTKNNAFYFTNIVLGGLNLTVQLDTGSSDLVVDLSGRQLNVDALSNIQTGTTFGSGNVSGNVGFADLQIGGFVINSQAFLNVSQTQGHIFAPFDGVMGMSFNALSSIQGAIANSQGQDAANELGNTPMVALFSQQPNLPDSFDVQLGRSDGTSEAPGTFIIGEHDENFQQITEAPPLPSLNQLHWSLVMDAMLVNGKPFTFNASRVDGVPQGKVAAVLDTGFTFPPLPPAAVNAIYSTIPGAVFDPTSNFWAVPCNASTSLSFVFANQEFAVHPLDLTVPTVLPSVTNPGQNVTVCLNAFRYSTLDPKEFSGFDLILGDSFLRNVYVSFNYGDANNGPFVQMLTTTPDPNKALQEFQTQRAATLANLPPTLDPFDAVNQKGPAPSGSAAQSGGTAQSTTTAAPPAKTSNGSRKGSGRLGIEGLAAIVFISGLVSL
ncbi:acid protease [Pilatotrama ljubarskyi]|nr:acid protease [Pilatotrama ljubarskyi]